MQGVGDILNAESENLQLVPHYHPPCPLECNPPDTQRLALEEKIRKFQAPTDISHDY